MAVTAMPDGWWVRDGQSAAEKVAAHDARPAGKGLAGERGAGERPLGERTPAPAGCVLLCLALSLSFTSTWLLNAVGYPLVDDFASSARYVAPLAGGVAAFVFALVSQYRPALFCGVSMLVATCILVVLATAGFYAGAALENAALVHVSASVRWIACVLRDIALGFALVSLPERACLMVLAGGYFLRYAWIFLLRLLPSGVQDAAFFLCAPLGLLMLWPVARPCLRRAAALDTPANLSVTNPMSFLPFTNRMFGAIVLFHAMLGFSTAFGTAGGYTGVGAPAMAVFAVVFALVCVRSALSVDGLYALSFLLTLAGFLLAPGLCGGAGDGLSAFLCNALCETGSSLFSLTVWYLGARIGARNLAGLLPLLCMVRAARGVGIAMGSAAGDGINLMVEGRADYLLLVMAALVLGFVAYNFLFARAFSFDKTAEGVEPLGELRASVPPEPAAAPPSDGVCAQLAAASFLTARELDVLRLLARGRNAAFIQEELGLTHNTAKSYVADVYRKLGVHSHQELIDLVERG